MELQKSDAERAAESEENAGKILPVWLSLLLVAGGLAALICGGKLFVNAAVSVARLIGVSEAVIGLTVVAFGTSVPELATSIVAAVKDENDIAIGNVVGSNIFNVLGILGVTPLIAPIRSVGINMIDMGIMLLVSVLLIIFMTSLKIGRLKGMVFLLIYAGYTAYLFYK
jgi:cation:H+ antiporter